MGALQLVMVSQALVGGTDFFSVVVLPGAAEGCRLHERHRSSHMTGIHLASEPQ